MPLQMLTLELARQIAADYPTLQSLNLSRNALNNVHHLKLLPRSLTQLDLGLNRLSLLPEELGTWLPELRLLQLRANALESLRPLVGCKELQTLDVGANRVALISELRFLQPLTQLRHLSLDGNPLADAPTYRREVLGMLPQLQSLDGQEVAAAERLYAKLQLKTQLGGDTGTSLVPSPRLLTPESFRSQRNSEQEVDTTLRVDVNGEVKTEDNLEDKSWEEDRNHRVEFHVSDAVERLPSPLVLVSTTAHSADVPKRLSESERPEVFQQTRRSDRRSNNYPRQNYIDSVITRESGRNHFQAVSRVRTVIAPDTGTRETLLKSRVEALEAILVVHDKTVRHTLTRFGERNGGSQLSVAGKNGSNVVPTVEAAAAVYTRLLAAWREKCVALMVQAQSSGLANEALIHKYQQQETKICEDLARCEEKVEMWQQRAADFEAQRDLEVVATRHAENQQAQANAKAVHAVRGLALEREKLQRLAETVVRFTGGLVRDKVQQLQSGSVRLEALERRLLLAKERVDLAATLVTHRETRLRNSEAALEAERRVWAHRLEQMRNMKQQDQETKSENNGDVSNAVVRPPEDGKLLRPVTEEALRALFHRLDAYDTGLVRSQVLLQALRRGDPGVLSAIGGPKKLSKLVSHVEAAIRKRTLAGGATKTLTWGEFLLFFIPESSVSLAAVLQGLDDSENGAMVTLEKSIGACSLCAAVKSNGVPNWPFASPLSTAESINDTDGDVKSAKKRKERKTLETLSHAELVQQNAILLADREHLRRLLARDAHDLQDRVRGVRREWEEKTNELVHQNEMLQRKLDEQNEVLHDTQKQREKAETAHDSAVLEVQTLREQLSMQEQEFELQQKKLEAERTERLQREQEIWQTEIQDMRLAHSLLQADHSKRQVRIRQLEKDLARQKEALLAHETERVANLEDKVRRRDTELARLRRERNTILSSLREQEQKLALATAPVEPTPTESIAIQTEKTPSLKQRTVASQTTPIKPPTAGHLNGEQDESRGSRMSINEISAPNSLEGGDAINHNGRRPDRAKTTHLTPEDVNLRLQKLQSLTESLLAD